MKTDIAKNLNLAEWQVAATIKLKDEDATIPFIARYRKDATGGLDEEQIEQIFSQHKYFKVLNERKEYIIGVLEEQGALTESLKTEIEKETDSKKLEDLFLPYKPKRETKADKAIKLGLKPLAILIQQNKIQNIELTAKNLLSTEVQSEKQAIEMAKDIVAQWISENSLLRNLYRNHLRTKGHIFAKPKRGKTEEAEHFKDYFEYKEPLYRAKSHRLLAVFRGSNLGLLNIGIAPSEGELSFLYQRVYSAQFHSNNQLFLDAYSDAFKRLIHPSIETELLNESKEKADKESVLIFRQNLEQLLLATPLGEKRILAIDPGFTSGCKVVVLNEQGDLIHNETIYPHPPKNKFSEAAARVRKMLEAYKIEAVAIGNGTAGKETENFIQKVGVPEGTRVYIVREDGASVYSASKVAREEFPQFDVTVRGAISIGRRLMDPLSELVKIEPKALGVGQYQHDVDQKLLDEGLNNTVEFCVNKVGINLNTASKHLLAFVSGLSKANAENIVDFRSKNGPFNKRTELKKVKGIGEKAFQLSAGFLRITSTKESLENTGIHPESYPIIERMCEKHKVDINTLIGNPERIKKLKEHYQEKIEQDFTLKDIFIELEKPGLDIRKIIKVVKFSPNLKSISDLKVGDKVTGIVTNITAFGAFIDVGIKTSGLLHLSEMANEYISNPHAIVKLNQALEVRIIRVELEKNRFAVSIKD
ncbi:MAG: Tex-like N-terminal domain-containing protein [Luteibaculaceae bacterium]